MRFGRFARVGDDVSATLANAARESPHLSLAEQLALSRRRLQNWAETGAPAEAHPDNGAASVACNGDGITVHSSLKRNRGAHIRHHFAPAPSHQETPLAVRSSVRRSSSVSACATRELEDGRSPYASVPEDGTLPGRLAATHGRNSSWTGAHPGSRAALAQGTLTVHLSHATDLKPARKSGACDPYVKLALGTQTERSGTIHKSCNPKWESDFEFKGVLGQLIDSALQLSVFHYEIGRWDIKLGSATFDLKVLEMALLSGRHCYVVRPLSSLGDIHLHVSWMPKAANTPEVSSRLARICSNLCAPSAAAPCAANQEPAIIHPPPRHRSSIPAQAVAGWWLDVAIDAAEAAEAQDTETEDVSHEQTFLPSLTRRLSPPKLVLMRC